MREVTASFARFEGDRFDDAAEIFADVALGETFPRRRGAHPSATPMPWAMLTNPFGGA